MRDRIECRKTKSHGSHGACGGIDFPADTAFGARSLHLIAREILASWPEPFFGAVPYLQAMRYLERITDDFGTVDGEEIVAYFLSNARTWRGPIARKVKTELRAMLAGGAR